MAHVRISVAEALINAVIGLLVSWAVTYLALPMWNLSPSPTDAAGITALFFVISFIRAFVIRELFRRFV